MSTQTGKVILPVSQAVNQSITAPPPPVSGVCIRPAVPGWPASPSPTVLLANRTAPWTPNDPAATPPGLEPGYLAKFDSAESGDQWIDQCAAGSLVIEFGDHPPAFYLIAVFWGLKFPGPPPAGVLQCGSCNGRGHRAYFAYPAVHAGPHSALGQPLCAVPLGFATQNDALTWHSQRVGTPVDAWFANAGVIVPLITY
jgi:hypothetical protein